ncbi:tyrosine-protein kinase STYK1-like isoform X2 [Pelobates fuscus]|uniref:tyrosine-protein kinase STYK1-like isoform X2 n=1 Tax=Pelobates fuscus TaxID=191477 RepID=UPI002FE437CA
MDPVQRSSNSSTGEFQRNENGWQNSVIIIPTLLSASTLIVVIVILWKSIRRKGEKKRVSVSDDTADLGGEWAVNNAATYENFPEVVDPILKKWEMPDGWQITDQVVICNGQYGPISRASLVGEGVADGKQDVVLKELSEDFSPGEAQDFTDLMKFHIQVCNHENLVKMLCCKIEARPLCLVLKAMNLGNLLSFLWRSRQGDNGSRVTEKWIFHTATQVASALEYLSGTHSLVHGFVAACNVLIHEDMTVELCGLGLTAIMHRTGSIPARRAAQVPLKWQSPERLSGDTPTEKSDMWSFGILLYEMVTLGSPPYPNLEISQVLPSLQKMQWMEKPARCTDRLYEVMLRCWAWEASQRPCFMELMKQLQNLVGKADDHTRLSALDTISQSDYTRLSGISVCPGTLTCVQGAGHGP